MYRQISKCTNKTPKKHYGGGGEGQLPLPPPCPPPPPPPSGYASVSGSHKRFNFFFLLSAWWIGLPRRQPAHVITVKLSVKYSKHCRRLMTGRNVRFPAEVWGMILNGHYHWPCLSYLFVPACYTSSRGLSAMPRGTRSIRYRLGRSWDFGERTIYLFIVFIL